MAQVEQLKSGVYRLSGNLDFSTVTAVLTQIHALSAETVSDMQLDLSGIERTNSAGLALLMELVADARKQNRKIIFQSVPEQLLDLARMSNVEHLLNGN